ncbi:TetR family transcriptional regulator [Halomonas sp. TRM85114]|uniref:TetR family transcriptional regulator n=1 Tax=Halomonas jincaotanensis TaxID=2810616 RepID=UPI001BD1F3E4|nr:TetR family transcriptional regulator [Halomonas jincaotanensis]MBS9404498.1 TetR family transcriptional regulator [Halomonas jincaotanensis]
MARRTKAEAAATREALLDAAEDVFFDKGVARTSLEQIARHAGMTRGAIYWHFRNKADLFHALLERVRMPFQELIDEIEDPVVLDSPLDAIRLACLHGFTRLEQPRYRRVHSILIHRCEFFSDIDPIAMQNELTQECRESLFERFSKAHEMGLMQTSISPAIATELLQATLGGLFHDWLRNPDQFSIRERGEMLINSLLLLMRHQESM